MRFTQIGSEGGYLPEPVRQKQLLIAPAERADVIVDFSKVKRGDAHRAPERRARRAVRRRPDRQGLRALRPRHHRPGHAVPREGGPSADTSVACRSSRPPRHQARLPKASEVRNVSLNELSSSSVKFGIGRGREPRARSVGSALRPRRRPRWAPGPRQDGPQPLQWMDDVTENPAVGAVESWNIRNFTMDAHPIHIHLVQFQVVRRVVTDPRCRRTARGERARSSGPSPGRRGSRTPSSSTRASSRRSRRGSTRPGLFVWHCHILEHEDNEMMRPYRVGPAPRESRHDTAAVMPGGRLPRR